MIVLQDSKNSTYNCLRTIVDQGENSLFCQFEDEVNFEEFYDLATDPDQLYNEVPSKERRDQYIKELHHLKSCQGKTCSEGRSEDQAKGDLFNVLIDIIFSSYL